MGWLFLVIVMLILGSCLGIIGLLLMLILIFLALGQVLLLFFIAGPRVSKYSEIRHFNGTVHYLVNGYITPLKPKYKPFLERFINMDGLSGGWSDGGRGADG
jgi:hypothetical protein